MSRLCGCICGLIVTLTLVPQGICATKMRGFPVQLEGFADVAAPLAIDIDDDGKLEIIAPTRRQIHVLEQDGNPVQGFSFVTERGTGITTGLAIGYIKTNSSQNLPVMFFGTANKQLQGIGPTGQSVPGFPIKLQAKLTAAPSLGDLDQDGHFEIIFPTENGLVHVYRTDGQAYPGYPAKAKGHITTSITVGKFRPQDKPILLFGDDDGRLNAWQQPGVNLKGFPYKARFTVASQPILGDIDDDGSFEVVFGAKDYKIHVVESDGSAAKGFPYATGYRLYSSCALADLDGNGVADIIATSGDGKLYVLTTGGRQLKGFPIKVGERLRSSPVAQDLDLDGQMEIVVGTDRNQLVVLRASGKRYPGFPTRMPDRVEVAPLLSDLTGNGVLEIIAASRDGTLSAFRLLKKGNVRNAMGWPTEAHDAQRSGIMHPNPPRYLDLEISPANPTTTSDLSLSYRFFDMDGDDEPKTLIRWYRNGRQVPELDGKKTVPASLTKKHQRWLFILQADADSPKFASPSVKVRNTPPGQPTIALLPLGAKTGQDLTMQVTQEAKDNDGDKISYRIAWLKDRIVQKRFRKSKIPSRYTAKGQRWTVVVTPNDGEVEGRPARVSLEIINTPPNAAKIALEPKAPTVTDPVQVKILSAGVDPDGDSVSYLYQWFADDKLLNVAENNNRLPAYMIAKHAKIRVETTSFDGLEKGATSQATAQVNNTAPAGLVVAIMPKNPKTIDSLRAKIVQPASDPNQDRLRYRYQWIRKRNQYKGSHADSPLLPSSETKKGETWTIVVTPNDGEQDGQKATATVTIGNTAPVPALVEALRARPGTNEALQIKVVRPPEDSDQDKVWTEVAWFDKGKKIASGRDMWQLPAAKTVKHGRYKAVMTPTDGVDSGKADTLWFEVQNSIPTDCQVRIEPPQPMTQTALKAVLTSPAKDADGDKINMRYDWFVDGKPIKQKQARPALSAERIKRGQRYSVSVTPFDGEQNGPACQAEVVIRNRPPEQPNIRILPRSPRTGDDLHLQIVNESKDIDGDTIHYRISWFRNGQKVGALAKDSQLLPASQTKKGEKWSVEVTPYDGLQLGAAASTQVNIVNTPPQPPQVIAVNARTKTTDELKLKVIIQASDADSDPTTLHVIWSDKRGNQLAAGPDLFVLPAEKTKKHGNYLARIIPSDGQNKGEEAQQWFQVENSPPTACGIAIQPQDAKTGQALKAVVTHMSSDVDKDKVSLQYRWFRNGKAIKPKKQKAEIMPGKRVKRDQTWTVVATPNDAEDDGPTCEASIQIQNSAPQPATISIKPANPTSLDSLSLSIDKPALDKDGDPIRYETQWQVDGTPFAAGTGLAPIPKGALSKNQKWTVSLVATDGQLRSQTVTASVNVLNSKPEKPSIAIYPQKPLSSHDLYCHLQKATYDPDGDTVTHRYEWFLLKKGKKGPKGKADHKGAKLPASKTKRGQKWLCRAQASDGSEWGPVSKKTIQVGNAAPSKPKIRIEPKEPDTKQELRCKIEEQASDPDGDGVQYRFQWFKDGIKQRFAAQTDQVPIRLTKPDDIWQCIVVATDGSLNGPPSASQEVLVVAPQE